MASKSQTNGDNRIPSKSSQPSTAQGTASGWQVARRDVSASEKKYILEGCRDGIRLDGRTRTELRPLVVLQDSAVASSHGSSRVILGSNNGGTHVLCSVRAELVTPSPRTPTQGNVEIHVDILESAAGNARSHKERRQMEQRLQSTLNNLLGEHLVDLEGLCVLPDSYVWKLQLDIVVLSASEGNLVDVASLAIRAAVQCTKLPKMTALNEPSSSSERKGAQVDLAVDPDIRSAVLPRGASECPVVVTVSMYKCPPNQAQVLMLDPSEVEEACASSRVHVAVQPPGEGKNAKKPRICGIQSDYGPLSLSLLPDITKMAETAATQVFSTMEESTIQQDLSTPQGMLRQQFRVM